MTKWLLICEVCGIKRVLDVGYNLKEFQHIYIFCKNCSGNTPHKVVGLYENETSSPIIPR
jgi:hypothetical protein